MENFAPIVLETFPSEGNKQGIRDVVHDAERERLAGCGRVSPTNDIVQSPRLREAVRVYVDRFLAVYDDEPFLVRLLIEGRAAAGAFATGDPSHAAVPYGDVGERFGLSRTHVRRLLGAAAEAGLVKLHARGGQRDALHFDSKADRSGTSNESPLRRVGHRDSFCLSRTS